MAEFLKPRALNQTDVERMHIPKLFWNVSLERVVARVEGPGGVDMPLQTLLLNYIKQLKQQFEDGTGLMLYGNNGRGKTAALDARS